MLACPRCSADVPQGNTFCGRCGSPASFSVESPTVPMPQGAAARLRPISLPEEGRFPPGTVLCQRYRISARVGKGGMGEVYRATDLLLGQSVALKFLPEAHTGSQRAIERLRDEVRLTRQISHPNICRVYDIGETGGQLFLSMEFIDGENLASLLRRIGRVPSLKALEIARRICAGLAAAHEKGVLHRDLKPANVMIDGSGQVLIADFGLACMADSAPFLDARGGTPAYMSPEQLLGVEVTRASDIYALGLVLFELFTGAPPHTAADREELSKRRAAEPPVLADFAPDADPAVDLVVRRCLDPDPRARPESALAVSAALPGGDRLAAALAMGETPSPDLVAAVEPGETMRPRTAAACLGAQLLCLLLAAWITGSTSFMAPYAADLDPDNMAQSARDLLAKLGYAEKPGWSYWSLDVDHNEISILARLDKPAIRARLAQDSPISFWYRASPAPMISSNPFQPFPGFKDPPLAAPGMLRIQLNRERLLQSFAAIPPAREIASGGARPFDWKPLFDAAGLDASHFDPAEPIWTPPSAFEARAAWLEKSTSPPLRVEAAAWHGRPVFFGRARNAAATEAPIEDSLWPVTVFHAAVLILISALAWYNLRKGRGDLAGAARFGFFMGAAMLVRTVLMTQHTTSSREYLIFVAIVGSALWAASTAAAGYLALEPFVRKRRPRALIAWTRFLRGGMRDPVVARHVLVGMTCGAGAMLLIKLLVYMKFGFGDPGWTLLLSTSISRFVEGFLSGLAGSAWDACWIFCLLFAAAVICRKEWLAACITGACVAASYLWGANSPVLELIVVPLLAIGLMFFALRFGLLALMAAWWMITMRLNPLTLDTSAFYFGASFATLTVVAGVGIYAYRIVVAQPRRARPDHP